MASAGALRLLITGSTLAIVGVSGWLTSLVILSQFDMRLEPDQGFVTVGQEFPISVYVVSDEPTNVFSGMVTFDPNTLVVSAIDYNTSIADLWAVLPWYSNGDGTVTFAGGTTKPGGFTGEGALITITFKSLAPGRANLALQDARILRHDGLGTDVDLVDAPIDAIFTVSDAELNEKTVLEKTALGPPVAVLAEEPDTDLNGDGLHSAGDLSIFMLHLSSQNLRSDFNKDGVVSLRDMSIFTQSQ